MDTNRHLVILSIEQVDTEVESDVTEFEASELALHLVEFTHELGEAIQVRIEFWSAISYGLIVLAYLAPDRLKIGVCTFLLTLYVLFSLNMLQVIGHDVDTVAASHRDALELSEQYGLNLESVLTKAEASSDEERRFSRMITFLYVPGLFVATIAFLGFTSFDQWRSRKGVG
jgi:hypothetical protein